MNPTTNNSQVARDIMDIGCSENVSTKLKMLVQYCNTHKFTSDNLKQVLIMSSELDPASFLKFLKEKAAGDDTVLHITSKIDAFLKS